MPRLRWRDQNQGLWPQIAAHFILCGLESGLEREMLIRIPHRDFIVGLVNVEDVAAMSAAHQPQMTA